MTKGSQKANQTNYTGRGGWRGGGRPKLDPQEREKRRIESKKKYVAGKTILRIPIPPEDAERFNQIKEDHGFKKNQDVMKLLLDQFNNNL